MQVLRLYDVAYCENFAANLVSFRQLRNQGYWWDNRPRYNCLRRADDTVVANLRESHNQFVLEYIPDDHPYTRMAFYIRKQKFNSRTERRPANGDAMRWHLRLGHPGPQALEHLVNASKGVRLSKIKTVNCDACGMAKATGTQGTQRGAGNPLALDFHDYEKG